MTLYNLIIRNCKLFFKDKGMFFSALITPMILLVLYATFLANVYHDSFIASFPPQVSIDESIIDATVGGQLIASLLAVSCITVAFSCNLITVQDKVNGITADFAVSPVKKSTLALSYYISTLISTLLICYIAAGAGFIYLGVTGWYLSAADILYIILDVFLLSMFGTVLSGIVNIFLSTQGQISAVSAIVSAGYGFICGAYMPMYNFSEELRRVLSFLPGTYGTALIKNHCLSGVFEQMEADGIPAEAIDGLKAGLDCTIEFFDITVTVNTMYVILAVSVALCMAVYICLNALTHKKAK